MADETDEPSPPATPQEDFPESEVEEGDEGITPESEGDTVAREGDGEEIPPETEGDAVAREEDDEEIAPDAESNFDGEEVPFETEGNASAREEDGGKITPETDEDPTAFVEELFKATGHGDGPSVVKGGKVGKRGKTKDGKRKGNASPVAREAKGGKKKKGDGPSIAGGGKGGKKKKRGRSPEKERKEGKTKKGKRKKESAKGLKEKSGNDSETTSIEAAEVDLLKEMATTPTGSDYGGHSGGICVPGVARVTLTPETQEILGCVIGKQVTPENPWIFIDKTVIDDNIDLHSESSDLLPIKEDITELKSATVLLGYDATGDNQFYICLTETAKDEVLETLEQMREEQQKRVHRALEKTPQQWISLGSEKEVDLFTIKNSRPCMQMQVETTVSDLNAPCNFVNRDVDDVPDGYYQFAHRDDVPEHAIRLRIDESVQVSLEKFDVEAQTEPGIPDNSWTQYEYSVDTDKPIDDEVVEKALAQFLQGVQQEVCDALHYNEIMDLHRDDYGRLVRYEEDTETPQNVQYNEFMSFTDMKHCQGKFVSCAAFHPTWSGVVALSYVGNSLSTFAEEAVPIDEINRDVYTMHPVLVWSFVDAFKPKLILDCPREVYSLAFAPHKENILAGGMGNGQIIIWDITGKIEKVEQESKMTAEQVKYNVAMKSLMDWMKSTLCIEHVRPVAVSAINVSHSNVVGDLHWISPNWEITSSGKFVPCEEGQQSLEVASSSHDGLILFWNLNTSGGGGSALIRSRRRKLSKRPEALKTETSPYAVLNRVWQPVFKVIIQSLGENRIFRVMCWEFFTPPIFFEEDFESSANLTQAERESMTTRFKFKPVIPPIEDEEIKCTAMVGTLRGQIFGVGWDELLENVEFIPTKSCSFSFVALFHIGPVFCIKRNPFIKDLYLSVGILCFAIWSDKLKGKPLLWRSAGEDRQFTYGAWSRQRPSMLQLTCSDGSIQVWDFLNRSDACILNQSVSGKVLTGIAAHSQYLPNNIVGVSDYNGSFRLFFIPVQYQESDISTDVELMDRMVVREKLRRETMSLWEDQWRERNLERKKKLEKDQEEANLKRAEKEEQQQQAAEEKRKIEEFEMEQIQGQKESGYSTRLQAIDQRWQETRKAKMVRMLLEKKKLQSLDLERQQRPVIAAQEAHQLKMLKLRQVLRQRSTIFKETIQLLFPELEKTEPRPTDADVLAAQLEDMDETFVHRYYEIEKLALQQVQPTPLEHTFNWMHTFQEGRARRQVLDTSLYRQTTRAVRAEERRKDRQLHRSSEIRREDEKRHAKAKLTALPEEIVVDNNEEDAPEDSEGNEEMDEEN